MDQRERAALLLFLDTGRAVGFVAKHQIKRWRTFGLSVSDKLQRLIGTKHDGHRLGVNFFEFACDLLGFSGHRHSQLSHVGVLVVATRTSVRTNADIAVRDIQVALTRPLPHRLAHQGNRGHEVQDPPTGTGHLLSDPQRHHRFAGTARQNQLPAVVFLETRNNSSHCFFLKRMRLIAHRRKLEPFRGFQELRPVDRPALNIGSVNNVALRGGLGHHRLGVRGQR